MTCRGAAGWHAAAANCRSCRYPLRKEVLRLPHLTKKLACSAEKPTLFLSQNKQIAEEASADRQTGSCQSVTPRCCRDMTKAIPPVRGNPAACSRNCSCFVTWSEQRCVTLAHVRRNVCGHFWVSSTFRVPLPGQPKFDEE